MSHNLVQRVKEGCVGIGSSVKFYKWTDLCHCLKDYKASAEGAPEIWAYVAG